MSIQNSLLSELQDLFESITKFPKGNVGQIPIYRGQLDSDWVDSLSNKIYLCLKLEDPDLKSSSIPGDEETFNNGEGWD